VIRFLIWLDAAIFRAATFGRYPTGMTISAAAWDQHLQHSWQGKVFVPLIDFVFRLWEVNHCRKAWVKQFYLFKDRT
jgi:hypothetical protein